MLDENFIEHQDEQIIVGMLPDKAKKELIDCYFNKGNIRECMDKQIQDFLKESK